MEWHDHEEEVVVHLAQEDEVSVGAPVSDYVDLFLDRLFLRDLLLLLWLTIGRE